MEASKTGGAIITDESFAICYGDVIHGANGGAGTTTDTGVLRCNAAEIVGIIHRRQGQKLVGGQRLGTSFQNRHDCFRNILVLCVQIFLIYLRRIQKAISGHFDAGCIGKHLTSSAQ